MSRPDVIGFARLALPGHAAIRAGDQVWTYRDLAFRARRLAWRLHKRGIGGGDRVAILSQNHIAHFDLLIAAPMARVIAVPLNIRLGPAELAAQVAQVTPKLLLVDAGSEAVAATLGLPTLRLADYERYAQAPVDHFTFFRMEDWEVLSREQVLLRTTLRDAYLVKVEPFCPDLEWANAIGVTSSVNTVHRGMDSLVVRGLKCRILEIRPLRYRDWLRDQREAREQGKAKSH